MFFASKGLCYVYIYHFKAINQFYIGSKKGDDKYYESSTTDIAFKSAIKNKTAQCYIVWCGEDEKIALALETYLIALAKDHFINIVNKNSGGGFGSVDTSVLSLEHYKVGKELLVDKVFPEIFDADEIRKTTKKMRQLAKYARTVVKDYLDKRENPLAKYLIKRNVNELLSLGVIQIRDVDNSSDHVDGIASRMNLETDEEWVRTTRPVSVIVDDSNQETPDDDLRCNGQHTLLATKKNNKYDEIFALNLPKSLFNNSRVAIEIYATQCNLVEEVSSKSPDPKKEIKLRLDTFFLENATLFHTNEFLFLEKFKACYEDSFTPSQISGNYNAWKDVKEEAKKRGDNFIDYKKFRGIDLLKKIEELTKSKFKTEGVTKVSVSSLDTEGFINPNNYFSNISPLEDTEVVLAHHTNTSSEHSFKAQMSRLYKIYDFNDWVLDKSEKKYGVVPFTKKGKKVYIVELPCRLDNLKAGSGTEWAMNIFSMVFKDE